MSERVEEFSIVARQFCEWAESEYPANSQSLKQALELITEVFFRGIRLIDEFEEIDEDSAPIETANDMGDSVYSQASNLSLRYYSEVYNSNVIPSEESVVGDLADDIADIYRGLRRGLDLFEAGYAEHAVWEWVFRLKHHWGEHATSAIRALYEYLQENEVFG